MFKNAAKIATFAIAGTLVVGGSALCANAENVYETTAVAGVALSVDDYIASVADETPAVVATASGEATSKKNAKFVAANVEDVVNIRKKPGTDNEVIGHMYKGDTGKVIKKKKNWTKIKSGKAVGWVKNEFLLFGDEAREYADSICPKTATVTTQTLNVRSSKSTDADIVTQIPEGNEYQVSKVSKDGDWVKISIDGDLKGYVSSDFVDVDVNYGKALTVEQEYQIEQERLAAEAEAAAAAAASATTTQQVTQQITTSSSSSASASSIKPTANASITTSNGSSFSNSSSSSQSTSTSGLGSQIASYALQFVGNPYVYGGTSLTNGADCSGFTMSVYAHFGYSLPHNAASQSGCGRSVSLSELQPGDLLFYKNGGGIGHVAMYTGGGMVVHASNKKDGIKTSVYNYRTPCKAVRIIG